ncbi:MAG: hypothetical protein RLY57_183 [Candidatus Parcubacteria bacterium]|jgi:hypothetical protein
MNLQSIQALIEQHPAFFLMLTFWSIVWKGLALWKAAQRHERNWFMVILIVNTFGILDLIYYYFVGRNADSSDQRGKISDNSSE